MANAPAHSTTEKAIALKVAASEMVPCAEATGSAKTLPRGEKALVVASSPPPWATGLVPIAPDAPPASSAADASQAVQTLPYWP